MYTELVLRCEIKKDIPENALNLIRNMISDDDVPMATNLDPIVLFGDRGEFFLRSASFYHHPYSYSYLEEDKEGTYLFVRCDCKNYDNEIERFIEWLTPYIDAVDGEFLGYSRYEEDDMPTCLYHPNKWVL